MRTLLLFLSLFILTGCKDTPPVNTPREAPVESLNASEYTTVLAPLIDPAKLDTLKGKRAATPRLRKACYWLQMAHTAGFDIGEIIDQAHAQTGPHEPKRAKAQRESLIRNRLILERLGCVDEAGMIKLRKGNAPTITKGPYAGEIVTGDHIIPRSVCPELDNALYNLEMMPLTLNQKKSAKIGQRQIDLARRWNQDGLLSDEGLGAVLRTSRTSR
ncbi:hypothetical protein N9046_08820 [Akkermansiaceae bacterium]|nr:hypothetical protein [Akkermansiaceae bacterium]MDB4470414.1 hypothetical protein [Akkermansiaceae bacterium]MDB4501773.1 hypothetical protein [Akkermansiaceae bacterium]MDB4748488.1 hypothetical protein [Akkermansiaceae bacterium]MDB4788978.1 hypothetical protein [Akkermansiaceae bacterium]